MDDEHGYGNKADLIEAIAAVVHSEKVWIFIATEELIDSAYEKIIDDYSTVEEGININAAGVMVVSFNPWVIESANGSPVVVQIVRKDCLSDESIERGIEAVFNGYQSGGLGEPDHERSSIIYLTTDDNIDKMAVIDEVMGKVEDNNDAGDSQESWSDNPCLQPVHKKANHDTEAGREPWGNSVKDADRCERRTSDLPRGIRRDQSRRTAESWLLAISWIASLIGFLWVVFILIMEKSK